MKQTGHPEDRPGNGAAHEPAPGSGKPGAGARKRAGQGVAPEIARQIDENLKRLYRQQAEQELPPELRALVARLKSGDVPADSDEKDGA